MHHFIAMAVADTIKYLLHALAVRKHAYQGLMRVYTQETHTIGGRGHWRHHNSELQITSTHVCNGAHTYTHVHVSSV